MPEPDLAFPESLCHRCRHCRLVAGKRSQFLLCAALPQKYLPQPVRACAAFEPKAEPPP
jgi:hypothetical protein